MTSNFKKIYLAIAALSLSILPASLNAQVSLDATTFNQKFPAPAVGEFGPHAEAPDNLDVQSLIGIASSPHTTGESGAQGDVVGAFRFLCDPAHILADDPVVYPNKPGKSHIHQFYGNASTNASSTYETQRASGVSTCVNELNRTGYWMPALISGNRVQRPSFLSIYYKGFPKNEPHCLPGNSKYVGECVAIPNALRFIFGFDMISGTTPTGGFKYSCHINDNSKTQRPGTIQADTISKAAKGCQVGDLINMIIAAPECWDGVNLDSLNHRSHLSNLVGGKCPASHPKSIPHFTFQAFYPVDANLNTTDTWVPGQKTWYLSSDIMYGMAPKEPGSTLHLDYFEGWNARIKKAWQDNCIDRFLNCSAGDLGNGYLMIPKAAPVYNRYDPIPAMTTGPFIENKLHAHN